MPLRHRSPRPNQPDLFTPPPVRPTWQSLPLETRQRLLRLLARMLRSASVGGEAQTPPTEVTDE